MAGFITEKDLPEAEESFPGITALWESLTDPPTTFLGLVAVWQAIIVTHNASKES